MEMADVSTDASASGASAAPGAKLRKRGGLDEATLNGDDVEAKKKKLDLGETGTWSGLIGLDGKT